MPSKYSVLVLALLSLSLWDSSRVTLAAEISTLFTTPEERQIINSNRYKSDEPRPVKPEPEPVADIELPIQQLMMEEVAVSYDITGITLSGEGAHTVWINQMAYEDGAQLEDNSRVKVMTGADIRVRITTPDGTHHYATSGETLDVTYLAPIEN